VWKLSRCSNGVRDFPRRETLCVFAAIYRATFVCTSRRRRHRGLSSACAWCPHFHAVSGRLVSLTRRSWSKSISPITCKTFSKRQNMTKKTKNADRNRPEMTTRSCFAPDVEEPSFQPQSPPFARHRDPASRSPHWAPGATPTPEPLALPRPRRLLAWASMAAARGAGGARISNAYLMLLGWRDEVFRHL
jgi:hypothetical protein